MVTKVSVVAPIDLGRGIVRKEDKKKYEVDLSDFVDGDTINYVGGKLVGSAKGGAGLDCSTIASLKKEAMSKTTTVLGRNGKGECVQVAVLDSIFQDVGVGLSASKYTGYVGDSFNVKVTVTNTGEGTNEKTTLSIIKPALGTYKISNQTHNSQGAGGVTKVSDTEYTITNLAKGGTVIVTFDVIGSAHGTYQFGATVDPQSSLDTNASNHRATISLNINTKADPGYEATNDCPAIVVTDVATGRVLKNRGSNGKLQPADTNYFENAIPNRSFRLDGASTVVVVRTNIAEHKKWFYTRNTQGAIAKMWSTFAATRTLHLQPTKLQPFDDLDTVISDYTFNPSTRLLTISLTEGQSAIVAMRPAGENCRWQYFSIGTMKAPTVDGCVIQSTPAPTSVTGELRINHRRFTLGSTVEDRTIDTNAPLYTATPVDYSEGGVSDPNVTQNQEVTYVVKKNTAKTISVTNDTCDRVSELVSNGKVKFTPTGKNSLTITIAGNAQPTDSITLGKITVRIVD